MAKAARSATIISKHSNLIIMAVIIAVLLAVGGAWLVNNTSHNNAKRLANASTASRTCIQWRAGAELPLKQSDTDPTKASSSNFKSWLKGGYNYVYYFVADGSQKDGIGKPYPAGQVVFNAPNYFTKSATYINEVKPYLDEIGGQSQTDAATYLVGDAFKNIVRNAIGEYNQNNAKPINELCAKFAS